MIFENFYPDELITSVYDLDWEKLAQRFKGVIFDIDNTLVPHGAPADAACAALFGRIHKAGIKTTLVSNNKAPRVLPFAEKVDAEYVCKAGKPKKKGYLDAMKIMKTDKENTFFIGDQIFTDVWGANRVGIYTMLTEPIDVSTDEIQITVKRFFEKPFRKAKP